MLALRWHSHVVTEIVHVILSRTLTFRYKDVSHSLIAKAGEANLNSGSIDGCRNFYVEYSGDGMSSLYLIIAALRFISLAQRTSIKKHT